MSELYGTASRKLSGRNSRTKAEPTQTYLEPENAAQLLVQKDETINRLSVILKSVMIELHELKHGEKYIAEEKPQS